MTSTKDKEASGNSRQPILKHKIFILTLLILLLILLFAYFAWHKRHPGNLILYGNVDIRDVNLGFRVSGRLLQLLVDEGDEVRAGQVLGHLDPSPYGQEVQAFEASVEQKKAALIYAQSVYDREKRLSGTGASSTDRYINAQTSLNSAKANVENAIAQLGEAKIRLQDTYLYAPSPGIVLTRAVEPGTMLAAGDPVLTISLINPVWVRAYITENELGLAKPGRKVHVYSDSFPEKTFDGQIGFVSPSAEFTPKTVETPDLRTQLVYRLRIVMQDPNHDLRQGMPVTVKVLLD